MEQPQISQQKTKTDLVLEKLDQLLKKQQQEAPHQQPTTTAENLRVDKYHDETAQDHYKSCPNCHIAINKIARPEILQEYAKNLQGNPKVECEGCGLIVSQKEEKCPGCGSTKAKRLT